MTQRANDVAQRMIESDHEFFAKSGPMPPALDDVRQFPRYYFRFCFSATLQPPRCGGVEQQHLIITRDLSRGGMSLIHTQQLFPGQRLRIDLNDAARTLEVQWCRRLGPQRYLVGCRFAA